MQPRCLRLPGLVAASVLLALMILMPAGCISTGTIDTSAMTFSQQPLVGKVVWNDLLTEDADAARRFYGGMFGWTFDAAASRDGRPYWLAKSGNAYVGGILSVAQPGDGTKLTRWLPYVSVEDVDRALAKVTAGGGKVAKTARTNIGPIAAIVDAEGAVLGLARSRMGDPDDRTTQAAPGRVVWTELLSNDPQRAAGFYSDVVGYGVTTIERRGGKYTMLTGREGQRAGIQPNPDKSWDPVWLTYFGVVDPHAAAAKAQSLGGKVLLPVSPQVREGTMAVIRDPTGAVLVLQKIPG